MLLSFPTTLRIKFNKLIPQEVDPALIEEVIVKSDELYYSNKMDLYVNYFDEYTTERYFSDTAAATEWIEFIKDAAARNNLGIVDINIINV